MKEIKIKNIVMDTRNYRVGKVIEMKKGGWFKVKFRDKKHLGDKKNGIESVHKKHLIRVGDVK